MQAECIQHGLRTIAFCKTRKLCELVTAYTRETLRTTAPHLVHSIAVYRAGYSPAVRPALLTLALSSCAFLSSPAASRSPCKRGQACSCCSLACRAGSGWMRQFCRVV